MVGVVDRIQLCILTIDSQGILGQVIGPNAEKIHLFSQFPANHDGCRRLNHYALFKVSIGDIFFVKLCLDLLYNVLDSLYFIYGNDHRIHDSQIAVSTGTKKRSQLRLKDLRTVQTDSDSPVSHGWIVFLIKPEILYLFVGSNIQSPDDHLSSAHHLQCRFVGLKLLFFSWIILLFQIEELTPEKANPPGVIGQHLRNISHASDIGKQPDLLAVSGHIFFTLQFLQKSLLAFLLGFLFLVGKKSLFVRIQDQLSLNSVNNSHFPIHRFRSMNTDQRRDIHGSGQDCRVGIGRAKFCYKS